MGFDTDSVLQEYKDILVKYNKQTGDKTSEIRKILKKILIENDIPLAGDIAYEIHLAKVTSEVDQLFNDNPLLIYMRTNQQSNVLTKDLYNNQAPNVFFTDLNRENFTRELQYIMPKTGIKESFKYTIMTCKLIDNSMNIRTESRFGYPVVSIDYILIDYYHHISQPRETESLKKWSDIYRKLNILQSKEIVDGKYDELKFVESPNRPVSKINDYLKGNKNVILVGDMAINTILDLDKSKFREYKILVVLNKFMDVKNAIHTILRPMGFRYDSGNGFFMGYHGPKIVFSHVKTKQPILTIYQSTEQCVPFSIYKDYQIARIPNIIKYLYFENPSPNRNHLIYSLVKARDDYFKTNDKNEFDSSIYQTYDIECLGVFLSALRKKRLKIYKTQVQQGKENVAKGEKLRDKIATKKKLKAENANDSDDAKTEDTKTEDTKTEDTKTEDTKTEDMKTEDMKTEDMKTGGKKNEKIRKQKTRTTKSMSSKSKSGKSKKSRKPIDDNDDVESFDVEIDESVNPSDFPYFGLFLPDPRAMFDELKNEILPTGNLLKHTYPDDHRRVDGLSNHFTEDVRIDCNAGDSITPRETWEQKIKDDPKTESMTIEERREAVYGAGKECNTFNPVLARMIIEKLAGKNSKYLDMSAGWGDRALGAIAANCDVYHGFDPNERLIPGHTKIIEEFADLDKQEITVTPIPFEDAELESDYYDIAMTSPPFFTYEIYGDADSQSVNRHSGYNNWKQWYKDYLTKATEAVKPGGHIVIYIGNVFTNGKKYNLISDTFWIMDKLAKKQDPIQLEVDAGYGKPRTRNAFVWKKMKNKK